MKKSETNTQQINSNHKKSSILVAEKYAKIINCHDRKLLLKTGILRQFHDSLISHDKVYIGRNTTNSQRNSTNSQRKGLLEVAFT